MNSADIFAVGTLVGIVIGAILTLFICVALENPPEKTDLFKQGYKEGQVDCIKGNIKYEIVQAPTVKEKETAK